MMKRLVVLGTGTEIGKTYVSARLARAWREQHGPCLALKPVESGLESPPPGASSPWDDEPGALLPASANGWFPDKLPQDSLSPLCDAGTLQRAASAGKRPLYGFEEPVSPHLAARRVGCNVELDELRSWVQESELAFETQLGKSEQSLCLIETAGGAFSPLSSRATNADLPGALQASSLLIAPNRLGVLHDVSSALIALATKKVRVSVVVLVDAGADDASVSSNVRELQEVVFAGLANAAPEHPEVLAIARNQPAAVELAVCVQQLLGPS